MSADGDFYDDTAFELLDLEGAGPCPWSTRPTPILSRATLENYQKYYFARLHNTCGNSYSLIAEAYPPLTRRDIQYFANEVKKFPDTAFYKVKKQGQRFLVDEISEEKIKELHSGDKRIQLNDTESREFINKEIRETAKRRRLAPSQVKPISNQNLKRLEKRLDIKTKNAEETTDARELACKSVRNQVTMAISIMAAKQTTRRGLVINFDAKSTQFGDKKIEKPKAKFIIKKGVTNSKNGIQQKKSIKVRKRKEKGITAFFTKSIYTLTDGGQVGKLVHIVASGGMRENEIHVLECEGLGLSGKMRGDPAIVVFAQTRTKLPTEFHLDIMWRRVIFPLLDKLREDNQLLTDTDPAAVFMDGGDDQLDQFKCPDFQRELAARKIRAFNPAGSTTEITQACDQRIFRSINGHKKKLKTEDVPHGRSEEFQAVSEMFAKHQNHLRLNKLKLLSTEHVRMGIDALLKLTILSQQTVNAHTVKSSFIDVAQDLTLPDREIMEICLNNCTTRLSDDQELTIYAAIPALKDFWFDDGRCTEKEMDDLGIPQDENVKGKPKDERVTAQQRTVEVTHQKSMERLFEEKRRSDADKAKRQITLNRLATAVENGTAKPIAAYRPRVAKRKLPLDV